MGKMRSAYESLIGKLKGKRSREDLGVNVRPVL
jgi:hypothetical protein